MLKKDRLKKRKSPSQKIVFLFAFILMSVYALLILFFFVYGILISIKGSQLDVNNDIISKTLFSFPKNFSLRNYLSCFTDWKKYTGFSYITMVWNSCWRTFTSAFLSWISTALVCYVLVHYKSKFTEFLYFVGLIVSMLPLYGGQGATYRLYKNLHLMNSPMINICSITLYGAYFFYMYAFWKSISHSYMEAASIDGADDYQILFRVMLPQVLPSITALFVMQFITAWNDYESTAVYMTKFPNLSYGIYVLSERSTYIGIVPMYFAGVVLALLPVLILFLIFQNSIMEKVYLGGLKG